MRPANPNPGGRAAVRQHETGSSLIELTIAIACAVTIVGAVMTATVRHSSHRKANAERSLASLAALDTLERMRSVPFGTLASMDGTGFDVLDPKGDPGGLNPQAGDPDGLPGRVVVRPRLPISTEPIYEVTTVVEWSGIREDSSIQFSQLMVERK